MPNETIALTPVQHSDAMLFSWFSYAMACQKDPQAHIDAACAFMKLRARTRKAFKYADTPALTTRQVAARKRAEADIDGLIALMASRSGDASRITATRNDDGTVTLTCAPRSIVLGRDYGGG